MAKIAVLGLGNFGTALACNWSQHGGDVMGWTVEDEVFASISKDGVNAKYMDGIALPGLAVTMSLSEAISDAAIVALALPSHVVLAVVDDLIPELAKLSSRPILLDLAKGLAPDDGLVSDAIREKLDAAGLDHKLAVMTGPTIAPELAAGVLTTALVASEDMEAAERVVELLSTPTFLLSAADDPLGVELWGGFKNVIALACGMSDGLSQISSLGGDNLKAALFTAGFDEGCRLLVALGAQPHTALTPAGVGDLFVTATSPHGRNRRTGELLGSGKTLDQAMGSSVMVSEGVRATRMFARRAAAEGVNAPFVSTLQQILDGEVDAETGIRALIRGS